MNRKGFVAGIYLMLAVVLFILGYALAPALVQVSGDAQSQLDCTNSSISNEAKANCTALDSHAPVFLGIIFGLAGIVLARVVT